MLFGWNCDSINGNINALFYFLGSWMISGQFFAVCYLELVVALICNINTIIFYFFRFPNGSLTTLYGMLFEWAHNGINDNANTLLFSIFGFLDGTC